MTKSAPRIARDALTAGEAALPPYGSRFSRRDHAQLQLFALLVLRQFLRTDYRGVVALAAEWRELREVLGLAKVPHYSTRARAAGLVEAAPVAAVDATGFEARHVSAYFGTRRLGSGHRQRAWPKLTAV